MLSEKELKFAISSGMIDVDNIREQIEMNERKKYLEMHNYKKWEGTDGKWHTYFPDEQKGRIHKKRNTEKEIDKLIIDYWKKEEVNPTVNDIFNEWNDRRLELKKISQSTHLRNKQYYNRHFGEFGKRKIKSVSADDILDFLEMQIPKYNLSAKSFSNLKGITKGFMKRAKKQGLINYSIEEVFYDLDVSESEFSKAIKEDYEEVFSENEMPVVIDYLTSEPDAKNLGILLMFVTGIRVGELVALKNDCIADNTFKIRRTETRYLKDGKYVYDIKEFPKSQAGVREVVVPTDYEWILKRIKMLNPFGEYVFVDDKGKRMTTNCFRRRLKRICERLEIYQKSPHKIRKTYGTILLDNNIDERLIIGQMGHTNIMLTEKHYHRNRRSINKKTQVLSAIPEFSSCI